MSVSITVRPSSSAITPALLTPDSPPGWSQTQTPSASSCRVRVGIVTMQVHGTLRPCQNAVVTCLAARACRSRARPRRCSPRARTSAPTWCSSTSKTRSRRSRSRPRATRSSTRSTPSTGARRCFCVRVNAWDTEWTYRDVIAIVEGASERLDELMLPEGRERGAGAGARHVVDADREVDRPSVARRHRGADRDGAGSDQRRRDLRGVRSARDDHLRSRRLRRIHRDAGAHRAACRSPSTRATTSTTCSRRS